MHAPITGRKSEIFGVRLVLGLGLWFGHWFLVLVSGNWFLVFGFCRESTTAMTGQYRPRERPGPS